ncbi:tRNA (adenosine(37)-N6)-threonylcarbamoyltransferase complex dimerization subunit type 1 TsaB [Myroides sp. LJL119]
MITILNIETATKNCSVSLSVDGKLVAVKQIAEQNFSHAEKLHVFIQELLQENKLVFSDLDAIAVSQGPGSYTGLRIGVSSVKGLCYALDIPMIAVDTLEVLARQVQIDKGWIVCMLDARRMEVFSAIFDQDYNQIRGIEANVIEPGNFDTLPDDQPVYFLGDGALKCKDILQRSNTIFLEDNLYPSAKEMVQISYDKFIKKQFVDTAYFEPFYLKDFVMTTKKSKQ